MNFQSRGTRARARASKLPTDETKLLGKKFALLPMKFKGVAATLSRSPETRFPSLFIFQFWHSPSSPSPSLNEGEDGSSLPFPALVVVVFASSYVLRVESKHKAESSSAKQSNLSQYSSAALTERLLTRGVLAKRN